MDNSRTLCALVVVSWDIISSTPQTAHTLCTLIHFMTFALPTIYVYYLHLGVDCLGWWRRVRWHGVAAAGDTGGRRACAGERADEINEDNAASCGGLQDERRR